MSAFWLALSFLTRLPVPARFDHSPAAVGRSVLFYPAVGGVIGGILVLAQQALADHAVLGPALLLALWVGLTGGLHLDGLADCADAWIGGQGDRERTLAIMKDPRSGPAAIAAVVLLLLAKYGALAELSTAGVFMPILWAPVVSRGAVPVWLLTTVYLRKQGLGSPLVEHLPRRAAQWTVALVGLAGWLGLGFGLMLLAVFVIFLLRHIMRLRLGGCTGDTLGAGIELLETAILVGAALMN
jgi:adenosylcobinamide-GDP ribazoletransferase